MPSQKMKTHKGTKKRFKVSATGKVGHKPCGSSHLNSHKSGKKIRRLRKKQYLKVGAERVGSASSCGRSRSSRLRWMPPRPKAKPRPNRPPPDQSGLDDDFPPKIGSEPPIVCLNGHPGEAWTAPKAADRRTHHKRSASRTDRE